MSKKAADYNEAILYTLIRITKPPESIESKLSDKDHEIVDDLFKSVKQVYKVNPIDILETIIEKSRNNEKI